MLFLAPLFLLFGLTASVPLVLHLYRHRQRIVMPFSTNRFFTQAIVRAQRRLRLRRILLLILRMAACLLIALALARPMLHGLRISPTQGNGDLVIILDDSLSMQAAAPGHPSRFEVAKDQSLQLLHGLSGDDRAAIITTTGRELGNALSSDRARLASGLNLWSATQSAGDVDAALRRAVNLFDSSGGRRRLVVLASDLQASDWSGDRWPQPDEPTDLVLDKVGDPPQNDATVETLSVLPAHPVVGQPVAARVRIINHSSVSRGLTLTVSVNGIAQSSQKTRVFGSAEDIETIPLEFDAPGPQRVVAEIDTHDELAADESFAATVQVRPQLPVLLVDGQSDAADHRSSAAFYLRAAMLASSQNKAVQVDVVPPALLSNQSLKNYGVIVLADVPSVPPREWGQIESFVEGGGGAAIFLGNDADSEFYNRALQPTRITSATTEAAFAQPMHVHRIELQHPVFDGFGGEARGAILDLDVYRAIQIDAGGAAVLATLDNDRPLVVERNPGRGRLLVWGTSPVPGNTNLPLRGAFIPLVSQMLSYLSGDVPNETHDDNPPRSESSPAMLAPSLIQQNAGRWHVTLTRSDPNDAAAILRLPQNWSATWDSLLWVTLVVVLVESLLAVSQGGARPISGKMRVGLVAVRGLAFVCLGIALLHIHWQSQTKRMIKPTVAVLLDDSRSMSVDGRFDKAMQIEKQLPSLLSSQRLVLFNAHGEEINASGNLHPLADGSPLVESLLRIQHAEQDQALAGIITLSDGIDTTHADESKLNVPVYPVEVAGDSSSADGVDLSIDAVEANRRALVGNTVKVVADLSSRGIPDGQPVAVSILQNDRPLRTKLISWPKDTLTQRVDLEFTPWQAGDMTFAMQVGPVPGEKNLDGNRKFFTMEVRANPITVLYIDGVLRWEGKFIREALSGDPDLNVITSIRTLPGPSAGSRGLLLPEQLARIDVVILGDVDATFFTTEEIEALRRWITEHGGGLLLTGGYESFGPAGVGRTELRQILPVEFSGAENPQIDEPFSLRLTDVGQDHPIFNFTGDRIRDTRFVQSLPPLEGCCRVAGVKPGAEILAVNPNVSGEDGLALPVMVSQQVGAGRTMAFAVDTTWKWRQIVGSFTGDTSFYQRFWGQIVRWLAQTENTKRQSTLDLAVSRASCKPGESVTIQAQLNPKSAIWKLTATALDALGTGTSVEMDPTADGTFRGTVTPNHWGRYDVIVTAEPSNTGAIVGDSSALVQRRAITIQVEPVDEEMRATPPDAMWLRKLAQRSGGQYLLSQNLSSWAQGLPKESVEVHSQRQFSLWQSPVLPAIFLSALCTEWIIRRKSLMV